MPSSAPHPLILRADASARIGTGHVMRCLALAQAWTAGPVTCASAELAPELERRLDEAGIRRARVDAPAGSPADAAALGALCRAAGAVPAALVIDGYRFDAAYQRALKAQGLRFLMFDDNGHAECYVADLVLNQNVYADETLYADRDTSTRLLLGCRYTLLRPEFLGWKDWKRTVPDRATRILVTLGGGDPDNVTLQVLEALRLVGDTELDAYVVVGPANPHRLKLEDALKAAPFSGRVSVFVRDMPTLMAWADVAVAAGGTTCWEMAFMGLPMALFIIADNQARTVNALDAHGVGRTIGWYHQVSAADIADTVSGLLRDGEQRRDMSARGRALVDGQGAARVVAALEEITVNRSD